MKDTVLELLPDYVQVPTESISDVIDRDDEITVVTDRALYTARYDTSSWVLQEPTRIAREPCVAKFLVIHDESVEHPDAWPVYGFVILVDGGVVYLNDAEQMADLGRRLGADLSAGAYAEVLARFHGPRTGYMGHRVVESPDLIPVEPGVADLSQIRPPLLEPTAGGYTLCFYSSDHPRCLAERWVLDVCRWTVSAPYGEPARWSVQTVHKDLPCAAPSSE